MTRALPLVTMTTYSFPRRTRRVLRWIDRNLHHYVANALLLVGLITAVAASLNWHDLVRH